MDEEHMMRDYIRYQRGNPPTVLIASTSPLSGKSAFAVGIGTALQGQGYAVGYCQPLLLDHEYDQLSPDHVGFMREALSLRGESDERVAPVHLTDAEMAEALRRCGRHGMDFADHVLATFRALSLDKDVMLVEGPDTRDEGSIVGLTAVDQARLLGAHVLVIARGHEPWVMDRVMAYHRDLGDQLLGVVFNIVPRAGVAYVTGTLAPALENLGVPVFGVLPEDRTLRSVSVAQVAHYLDGRIAGGGGDDALVEHIVIGAMGVESAVSHLKRRERTAFVTGGDRTDLLLAALKDPDVTEAVSCIVLTGDAHPAPRVLALAAERGVPCVIVPHDTRTATDHLNRVFGKVRFAQGRKIERFNRLLADKFDFPRFARAVRLD